MRLLLSAAILSCATVLSVEAAPARVYTRPELPAAEKLQPLGLKERWHIYVPMAGKRDYLTHIQIVDDQLVVQTASGNLLVLNPETGATLWQLRLGEAYKTVQNEVGANDRMFFALANSKLLAIDRDTGKTDWTYQLPGALAAAPSADAYRLYVVTGSGRMHGYFIPLPRRQVGSPGKDTPGALLTLKEPQIMWSFHPEALMTVAPIVTSASVVLSDNEGKLYCFQKERRALQDQYQTNGPIIVPIAQLGDALYVASQDTNLYALEVLGGRFFLRWRFSAGSPVIAKPAVVGDDVYIVSSKGGLSCLDRHSGDRLWQYPQGVQFIAASKRLVFAEDSMKQTVILDRQKGKVLGTLGTRDFAFRVMNDTTDRFFLANHDGLIVCLQDIDKAHDNPVYHNLPPKPVEPPKPAEGERPAAER